jgi:hypothetical protein
MRVLIISTTVAAVCGAGYSGESPSQSPAAEPRAQIKRALVEKALGLSVGDSYQTVTNRLGTPTFDTKHQDKGGRFFGRSLKYSFHSQGTDLLEGPFPESIVVYLDGQGRVRCVTLKATIGEGEPAGAVNRSQPAGSQTNRTSPEN